VDVPFLYLRWRVACLVIVELQSITA
jgi:hypothetical protein